MKKVWKVVSFMLVMMMVLTACQKKVTTTDSESGNLGTDQGTVAKDEDDNTTKEPIELTLWHETEESISTALQEEFAKLEPEIKVNVVRKDNITEALKLAAGDPTSSPDLIWFAHDKIGLFAEMNIIESVDSYVEASEFDKFLPLTKEASTYNGKHYQIPVYYETLMFMYNKALLDKAPETTDELLEMMKSKTIDGNYGFVEQHSTAYYASAWIHAFGGSIINDKAEPLLNTNEMIEALSYHKEFVQYMPVDGEWNTVTTMFLEGKAASIVNGPWFVASAKDAGITLGVAPLPTVSKNGQPLQPYSGVQGIMLSTTCKDKEAAKVVLNQLCKKDLSEAIAIKNGAAPAHSEAYNNAEIQKSEIIMTLRECADNAVPMPNIPQMDVLWSCTENALASINKSNADITTTLNAAQEEAVKQIKAME